jgi:iron(III) transport system permease protein
VSRARSRWQEPAATLVAASLLCVAIVPPLAHLALELLGSTHALGLLADGRLWWLLARSISSSLAVTLLALAVGAPLGVLFAAGALPLPRLLFAAHVSVALVPPFLPALGWFHLWGRQGVFGSELSARLLFSDVGVVVVLAICFTPIVTALTAIGVHGVEPSLEEAARLVGGPLRTATRVLVPCAAPAISLGAIVVFALAFSELGVPMFLRVDAYPAVVFARLGGLDFAPGEAAIFVLPSVAVALGLFSLERRFAGRRAIAALGGHRARAPLFRAAARAGAPRPHPAACAFASLAALASALPLASLAAQARRADVEEVWRWMGESAWNGLRASALAALVMTLVALVLGRALARRSPGSGVLDGLATLAFVLPSSIVGVGIVGAWNRPATSWLYASFGVLVVGFVARYGVVATRAFAAVVAQVPASLDDAARTVGAGYLRRLALLAAMTKRQLVATFVIALVLALRDLETAALFYPPGGEPLTVRIFTLEANGPPAVVSALAVLHVLITFAAASIGLVALARWRSP